ncbi:hypothetical protein ACTXT7_007070 [Hymenolepis weldensis]
MASNRKTLDDEEIIIFILDLEASHLIRSSKISFLSANPRWRFLLVCTSNGKLLQAEIPAREEEKHKFSLDMSSIVGRDEAAVLTVVTFAKMCIAMSFASAYVFASEVYPTSIINVAVGFCVTCGRLGGTVAPVVKGDRPIQSTCSDRCKGQQELSSKIQDPKFYMEVASNLPVPSDPGKFSADSSPRRFVKYSLMIYCRVVEFSVSSSER